MRELIALTHIPKAENQYRHLEGESLDNALEEIRNANPEIKANDDKLSIALPYGCFLDLTLDQRSIRHAPPFGEVQMLKVDDSSSCTLDTIFLPSSLWGNGIASRLMQRAYTEITTNHPQITSMTGSTRNYNLFRSLWKSLESTEHTIEFPWREESIMNYINDPKGYEGKIVVDAEMPFIINLHTNN